MKLRFASLVIVALSVASPILAQQIETQPAKRFAQILEGQAAACSLHIEARQDRLPGETDDALVKRNAKDRRDCTDPMLERVQPIYKEAYAASGESAPRVEQLYAAWILWVESLGTYDQDRTRQLEFQFQQRAAELRADVDRR